MLRTYWHSASYKRPANSTRPRWLGGSQSRGPTVRKSVCHAVVLRMNMLQNVKRSTFAHVHLIMLAPPLEVMRMGGRGPTVDYRVGHVLDVLRAMGDNTINCVVTSPPYIGACGPTLARRSRSGTARRGASTSGGTLSFVGRIAAE